MPAFEVLIWDLDGTLTDSASGIMNAIFYAVKKMGFPPLTQEEARAFIGPPLHDSFQRRFDLSSGDTLRAVDAFREYYREKGIWENRLYPDVAETLQKLSGQQTIMAVATAKPRVFAEKILGHFQVSHYFSIIAGSLFDGSKTDKDELIRDVLSGLAFSRKEAVCMIGDRLHDYLGAKKAGVSSCAVTYGYGTREEWDQADYSVSSPLEIITRLAPPPRDTSLLS